MISVTCEAQLLFHRMTHRESVQIPIALPKVFKRPEYSNVFRIIVEDSCASFVPSTLHAGISLSVDAASCADEDSCKLRPDICGPGLLCLRVVDHHGGLLRLDLSTVDTAPR